MRGGQGRLVESGHRANWSLGPATLSVSLHVVAITAALRLTTAVPPSLRIAAVAPAARISRVELHWSGAGAERHRGSRDPRPPHPPAAPEHAAFAPPPAALAFATRLAISATTVALRRVDLLPPVVPAVAAAPADAITRSDAQLDEGDVEFLQDEVDGRAALVAGQFAPPYPSELRAAHPDGRVLARFVIDSSGRVEPASITIVATTRGSFAESVRRALPLLRFVPARRRGRNVRTSVEQAFDFHCAC